MLLLDFIDRQFIHNNPPSPTASFKGKTAIVTGSNIGLGKEACRLLVHLGASLVIIACRNVDKGKAAAQDIRSTTGCSAETLQVWQLDMSSNDTIVAFSDRVKHELPRLDVLISNAGLATRKFRKTGDDEEMIRTNVVALFLHALLLLPKLHETSVKYDTDTYLTVTSSELYEHAKFNERKAPSGQLFAYLNDEQKTDIVDRYPVSKLLEVFVIKQLAQMYPVKSSRVIMNYVAPGFCNTGLSREHDGAIVRVILRILCRSAEVGARTLVHGACAGRESHGQYLPDCKITPTKGLTSGKEGQELQERIWEELKQKLEDIQKGVTELNW